MKILFKTLKFILLIILAIDVTGFLYERISRFWAEQYSPPSSDFVDLGRRRLHYHKEGHGDTTVVFESGLGGDYLHWKEIQQQLASRYTTISYDKAGILWSDKADTVSLARFENDLSQLLEKTHCPKPYILVGHSFAGITLRKFVQKHGPDIAGVVFIDVSHPRQLVESSETLKKGAAAPPSEIVSLVNEIGILRVLYSLTPFTSAVSADHWFNRHVPQYFYKILPGMLQEMENDDRLMAEAEQISSFGNIPLGIITAGYPEGVERVNDKALQQEYLATHHRLQKDLLNLSSNSRQTIAAKSGHYVTLQEPEVILNMIQDITAH